MWQCSECLAQPPQLLHNFEQHILGTGMQLYEGMKIANDAIDRPNPLTEAAKRVRASVPVARIVDMGRVLEYAVWAYAFVITMAAANLLALFLGFVVLVAIVGERLHVLAKSARDIVCVCVLLMLNAAGYVLAFVASDRYRNDLDAAVDAGGNGCVHADPRYALLALYIMSFVCYTQLLGAISSLVLLFTYLADTLVRDVPSRSTDAEQVVAAPSIGQPVLEAREARDVPSPSNEDPQQELTPELRALRSAYFTLGLQMGMQQTAEAPPPQAVIDVASLAVPRDRWRRRITEAIETSDVSHAPTSA